MKDVKNIAVLDETEIDEILEQDDDINPLTASIILYGSIEGAN